MRSLILSFLLASGTFSALNAQLSMPYETGFDNVSQQSGWTEYRKGVVGQFQEWDYEAAQAFSAPNCVIHNYPVGGADPMDDWFVSPAFNISAGGALDSLRYYFSGFGTPQAGDTVFIYLLNGSQDPALATSVEILHEFSGANYQNDNTWRLLAPIALPARPGNSYIAFRYKTINNWLDVRFDNVGISRISLAGTEEAVIAAAQVYPNPVVNKQVNIQFDAAQVNESFLTFTLYDAAGKMVQRSVVAGNEVIDLQVAAGLYTYEIHGASDVRMSSGKIVVE